jgi:predicted GNAT family N-acyltransferase
MAPRLAIRVRRSLSNPVVPVCTPIIADMAGFQVVTVTTLDQMHRALDVRRRVFIEEQEVPEELEIDEHDADPATVVAARHVLAHLDGTHIATGRLLLPHHDEAAHIGRVAVLAEYRGAGAGRAVMLALHDLARQRGIYDITLAAQLHAIGFYERLGYVVRDDVFLDAGIQHRWMDLRL